MSESTLEAVVDVIQFWYHFLIILTVVIIPCWIIRHRRGKALPATAPSGSRTIHIAESLAIAGICFACYIAAILYRTQTGIPYAFAEGAPVELRWEFFGASAIVVLLAAVAMLLCWVNRTIWALLLVMIGFSFGFALVDNGELFGRPSQADDADQKPAEVVFAIDLKHDVAGADILINGVHLGKTPFEITCRKLIEKVPVLTEEMRATFDDYRVNLKTEMGTLSPYQSFSIPVLKNEDGTDVSREREAFFVSLEWKGEKMYSAGHAYGGGHERFVTHMEWLLPKWISEVEHLLNHARFHGYQVDDKWLDAIASYGEFGFHRLEHVSETDIRFQPIVKEFLRHLYHFDEIQSEADAWNLFERLCREADDREEYSSDSLAGKVVELIVPLLDENQLIERFERRKTDVDLQRLFGVNDYLPVINYPYFSFHRSYQHHPADSMLAHALWKKDAHLDLLLPEADNPIETFVVPELLRSSAHQASVLKYCNWLGGSIYERFVLRHDLELNLTSVPLPDVNTTTFRNSSANTWFVAAAYLNSPAGVEFRTYHRPELEQLALAISEDIDSFFSIGDLTFLFLAERPSRPSLAKSFWPTFLQKTFTYKGMQMEMLQLRWLYLANMGTDTTVEQFVEAYREPVQTDKIYDLHRNLLGQLEPQFQFAVLSRLIECEEELADQNPDRPNYNLEIFADMRRRVPLKESAEFFLEWYRSELLLRGREPHVDMTDYPILHSRALLDTQIPERYELVLEAIKKNPTPERRELLEIILKVDEEEGRKKALEVQQHLQEMKAKPLPKGELSLLSSYRGSNH